METLPEVLTSSRVNVNSNQSIQVGQPPSPQESIDPPLIHPHDKFWAIYLANGKELDKTRIERWKGDTDGILIFTGLFAATVATLVVNSSAQLSPDSASETVALLAQLVALANGTHISSSTQVAPPQVDFRPSPSAIWVNTLWFLSLFIALVCAMLATMVQQWSRRYLHDAQIQGPPHIIGPVHAYLSKGIDQFRLNDSTTVIVSLLHLSVFLFFIGLLVFLFSTNSLIAWIIAGSMATYVLLYMMLSIMPMINPTSPYETPLTLLFQVFAPIFKNLIVRYWPKRLYRRRQISFQPMPPPRPIWSLSVRRVELVKRSTRWPNLDQFYFSLQQVTKSVDELHELEALCEALVGILAPSPNSDNKTQKSIAKRLLYWGLMQNTLELVKSAERLSGPLLKHRIAVAARVILSLDSLFPSSDHPLQCNVCTRSNINKDAYDVQHHGVWSTISERVDDALIFQKCKFSDILLRSLYSAARVKVWRNNAGSADQEEWCAMLGHFALFIPVIFEDCESPEKKNDLHAFADIWKSAIDVIHDVLKDSKTPSQDERKHIQNHRIYHSGFWASKEPVGDAFPQPSTTLGQAMLLFRQIHLASKYPDIYAAYPDALKKIEELQDIISRLLALHELEE